MNLSVLTNKLFVQDMVMYIGANALATNKADLAAFTYGTT